MVNADAPVPATETVRPPPSDPLTVPAPTLAEWARVNLFSNWHNTLLTVVFTGLVASGVFRLGRFVFSTADWEVVQVNLTTLLVGTFQRGELYRLWIAAFIVAVVAGMGVGISARRRGAADIAGVLRANAAGLVLVSVLLWLSQTPTPGLLVAATAAVALAARWVGLRLPVRLSRFMPLAYIAALFAGYAAVSAGGGIGFGQFEGLLLNLFLALGGITFCFPLGILLALGRRSSFPAVRIVCTGYIELIRGTPLIVLLLLGATMLGFFLPPDAARPGGVARALVVFVLFAAAYVAEDVRGGLQGVPAGQVEAAKALGMSPLSATLLIVLPQGLRNVLPALVSQFISITKDTVLVAIIGLVDVLRVARAVTSQPDFVGQGLHAETLLFAAFLLWSICFTMSRSSQRLETRLGIGQR